MTTERRQPREVGARHQLDRNLAERIWNPERLEQEAAS